MNNKPKIFIGSSDEAKDIDKLISAKIAFLDAEILNWKDSETFPHSNYPLDLLLDIARKVDGAMLIATADDLIKIRGKERISPRDNIILEMGIFFAILGKPRTVILLVNDKQKGLPDLPSNIKGLKTMNFDTNFPDDIDMEISHWLENLRNLRQKSKLLNDISYTILPKLSQINENWLSYLNQYIINPFRLAVDYIHNGEVLISIGDYYQCLYEETDIANKSTDIMAISNLSSHIWTHDKEQQKYLKKNIESSSRGTKINRIFILHPRERCEFEKVLELQKKSGIKVKFADPNILIENRELKDMAIFMDKETNSTRIYVVDKVLGNPNRIYGAK